MNKLKLCIILIVVLMCSSCFINIPSKSSLHICGSYAVPGMFYQEIKGGVTKCEVIEKDSFNRKMFTYTTINNLTQKEATVLVILQKTNTDYVYFYEDICYISPDASEEELELFKYINDWNKQLNLSKASKRAKKEDFGSYIIIQDPPDTRKVKENCLSALDIEDSQLLIMAFDDNNENGFAMYYVEYLKNENLHKKFMLVNKDLECHFYDIQENTDFVFDGFREFKIANGWYS